MTRDEVKVMMDVLKKSYPNFYKTEKNLKDVVDIWEMIFKDDSREHVMQAVALYIATEKFPPTIADIREKMVMAESKGLTADEAWGQVQSAFSKFGYTRQEEAMEWFHPEVALLVRRLGWTTLCRSEDLMADRAHFIKLWNARSIQNQKNAMLPEGIKKQLELNWQANDMHKAIGYDKEGD